MDPWHIESQLPIYPIKKENKAAKIEKIPYLALSQIWMPFLALDKFAVLFYLIFFG
jgi:hypothetical protein